MKRLFIGLTLLLMVFLSTVDEPAVLKTILAHELGHMGFGHPERDTVARVWAFDDECGRIQSQTGRRSRDVKAALDLWQSDEFLSLVREEGSAALVATHNERLAKRMDRVVRLHDGRLE